MLTNNYKQYPAETAAAILAQEQHAPGVVCYVGGDFRVHYRRPDGSVVPDYAYFLRLALAGLIRNNGGHLEEMRPAIDKAAAGKYNKAKE